MDDTPWWSNLIGVIVSLLVGVLIGKYATGGVALAAAVPAYSPYMELVKGTLAYLPHILLFFGILVDVVMQRGAYSIATGFGFLSIFVNVIFKFFWRGLFDVFGKLFGSSPQTAGAPITAMSQYDGCTVEGFGFLGPNEYAPQTLVVTATILSYFAFDISVNRGLKNAIAILTVGLFLFLAQASVIKGCNAGGDIPATAKAFAAMAEGLFTGGVSYALMQAYAPEKLPSSAMPYMDVVSKSSLTEKNGKMVDSKGIEYVPLPNGMYTADLSTTAARSSLAETLGSGKPPKTCSS